MISYNYFGSEQKVYYDKLDNIGNGAFGIISKGREKETKKEIGMKNIMLLLS